MLQMFTPPVRASAPVSHDESRRFQQPQHMENLNHLQRRDSSDSASFPKRRDSRDSTGSKPARRESAQIEVPLQVVSSGSSDASRPMDFAAPLPPQLDSMQSGHSLYHQPPSQLGQLSARAVPGSLRCASQALCLDAALVGSAAAMSPSAEANSVATLQEERRNLLEWGESLVQQVGRLEQEKARLEQTVAAASASGQLRGSCLEQSMEEIERLKRRGSELERQVSASKSAAKDNEELRKQLAAYAVEVDALRDENEKMERSRREAHEEVQRLIETCEELRSQAESHKETELLLEDLRQQQQETLSKLTNEARDNTAVQDENTKALSQAVKSLHRCYVKLQEGFISQTREFGEFVASTKEQQRQAHEEIEASRREAQRQLEVIERLQSELGESRSRHEESCQWWQERASHQACEAQFGAAEAVEETLARERLRAEEFSEKIQRDFQREREEMQVCLTAESARRRKFEEELCRKDQCQRERNVKRQRRLGMDRALLRLERALERNIARDIFKLEQGTILEKVHDRNCRREARMVVVLADEMQIRWGKDLRRKLWRTGQSRLDLYEVIHIHYGSMNRASVLHTEVPPWLCFSLHTPRRSYDFCCPDEEVVQRFVLGISRLCDWASGTITTRSRFVAKCAWCKLEDHCFHEQISLGKLFLEAIDRIRDAPAKLEQPQSPCPRPPI